MRFCGVLIDNKSSLGLLFAFFFLHERDVPDEIARQSRIRRYLLLAAVFVLSVAPSVARALPATVGVSLPLLDDEIPRPSQAIGSVQRRIGRYKGVNFDTDVLLWWVIRTILLHHHFDASQY